MSRIIQYGIHFNEMAKKHEYLSSVISLAVFIGNMLDAGIIYSVIIGAICTIALFAIWKE